MEAVITSVDVINQRISLSMKELLPNEWEEYANAHGVGDLASGVVTNITDFGVFVELAPGVEGLCHISEIDRDTGLTLAETFMSGQKVTCRILRIDWNENRIGLSMHSVDQVGDDEIAEMIDAPVVETAMAAALKAGGIVEETAPEAEELSAESGETEDDTEDVPVEAESATETEADDSTEVEEETVEAAAEESQEVAEVEDAPEDESPVEAEAEAEAVTEESTETTEPELEESEAETVTEESADDETGEEHEEEPQESP